MTIDDIQNMLDDEEVSRTYFLRVEQIAPDRRLSSRPDLNAFLLLDRLVPGTWDMVAGAEHDEIFLDVSLEALAASAITPDDVLDLIRCGVRYDSDGDGLAMFA